MLKLINLSTQAADLGKFHHDSRRLDEFLHKHRMDGIELIQYDPWEKTFLPSSTIKGLHMTFWPSWLDFWRMNIAELEKQFGDNVAYEKYYGGKSPTVLVEYYRREIRTAVKLGVKYVVFHVSHVQPEHCYTYEFTYSDREIVEAFIELINQVLEGVETELQVLFENLWWPGLTLLDREIAYMLMERVKFRNKGFMLDTGHLMNTNTDLENEAQAVGYMMRVLENLGELSAYIQGIHLNNSLSGEYVKKVIQSQREGNTIWRSGFSGLEELCRHVVKIDRHEPFTSTAINKIVHRVNPRYLVYELLADSLEVLERSIEVQDCALGYHA